MSVHGVVVVTCIGGRCNELTVHLPKPVADGMQYEVVSPSDPTVRDLYKVVTVDGIKDLVPVGHLQCR